MAEITYLLGAGASCGALPIVSDMAQKIGETIRWLREQYGKYHITNRYSTADAEKFNKVIDDLTLLQDICDTSKNFSVDTYARKLNLSGRLQEYLKLKNILSFYFTLAQRQNPPDVRYDNFWASILKHKSLFPNNIKIISWNYDFQLELTYQDFLDIDSLKDSREQLNVISLETTRYHLNNSNEFSIFKLNGSATYRAPDNGLYYFVDQFNTSKIDEFIIASVHAYEKMSSGGRSYQNHLSFAWEHTIDSDFYSQLKNTLQNTEILVVIGYSFPFFNRDIDKLIFNEYMGNKLKKVYFQAPDAEDLRERFLAINDKISIENLVLRKDIKQFTLPNEL